MPLNDTELSGTQDLTSKLSHSVTCVDEGCHLVKQLHF